MERQAAERIARTVLQAYFCTDGNGFKKIDQKIVDKVVEELLKATYKHL